MRNFSNGRKTLRFKILRHKCKPHPSSSCCPQQQSL
jgi:hypothetical protein